MALCASGHGNEAKNQGQHYNRNADRREFSPLPLPLDQMDQIRVIVQGRGLRLEGIATVGAGRRLCGDFMLAFRTLHKSHWVCNPSFGVRQ